MEYELTLSLDSGASFAISDPSLSEVAKAAARLGLDESKLRQDVTDAMTAYNEGNPLAVRVKVVGGNLMTQAADDETWPSDEAVAAGQADESQTDSPVEVDNDPWGVPAAGGNAAASTSAPSRATSAPASRPASAPSGPRSTGVSKATDNFGGLWTFGLPDAPTCDCGETAAKKVWETLKNKDTGKKTTAFVCAKGGPGGNFRDKCEFFQFPGGK